MIDNWHVKKNLGKIKVYAAFHSRIIRKLKCLTQIYKTLYGEAMLVSFRRAPTWRPYNNRNFSPFLLKREIITLESRHIESNNSSSARTVKLPETWAITLLLTPTREPYRHFKVNATDKLGNSSSLHNKTNNPVELKRCKTSSSYKLLYLTKTSEEMVICQFGKMITSYNGTKNTGSNTCKFSSDPVDRRG